MRPPPDEFLEWLLPYSDEIRDLALAVRGFVVERAPNATEIVADGVNAVSMGLSYTHTHVKGFVYVAVSRDHVNLGFNYGASLPDPHKRLLGSGNQSRHIKIWEKSDLDDPVLAEIFELAHAAAFRPDPPLPSKLVLMPYLGARSKRRPPRVQP